MNEELRDRVIRMAWEDRTTFDEIEEKTGLSEAEVIKVMRGGVKTSSFRRWRKRVSGRVTKHRGLFERSREEIKKGRGRQVDF
ncbi:MAG: TIGR03643 family protein [Verrucomicrobiaceae bacterium]